MAIPICLAKGDITLRGRFFDTKHLSGYFYVTSWETSFPAFKEEERSGVFYALKEGVINTSLI